MASEAPADADLRLVEVLGVLVRHQWLEVDAVEAISGTSKWLRAAVERSKLRKQAVRNLGFPATQRIRYWLQAAGASGLMSAVPLERRAGAFYLELIGIANLDDTASLENTGVEGEIARDVERTFPTHPFFADGSEGRRQLGNVLKAISVYAKDTGYCQGMNYVVAALLITMTNSEDGTEQDLHGLSTQEAAFWLTLAIIRRRGMADLWRHKMPGLSRCIYLYQQLVQLHFYDLSAHLRHIGLHSSFLATQWFVTLFARALTTPTVERVWDLFFFDGWKAIYRVALAITAYLRPKLLNMDMEQFSEYFRKHPRLELKEGLSAQQLLAHSLQYKVTRSNLKRLEEERHLEYLRLRLQQTPLSDEHRMLFPALERDDAAAAQRESLDFIRSQLRRFDADVASDTVVLQHKIEAAERAQAQALSSRFVVTYELSEATMELDEHSELKTRLLAQFRALTAAAIAEASSASSSGGSASLLPAWVTPAATLEFFNTRVLSCFEKAVRLPLVSSRNGSKPNGAMDLADEQDELEDEEAEEAEEARRNLVHLEVLVPHLAAELRALERQMDENARVLRPLRQRVRRLQHSAQLARVEVEEAQQFKDRLADQLLQIMLASEKLKNARMQQLFAEVDEAATELSS